MESTEWIDSWLRSFCGNSSGLLLALLLVGSAGLYHRNLRRHSDQSSSPVRSRQGDHQKGCDV